MPDEIPEIEIRIETILVHPAPPKTPLDLAIGQAMKECGRVELCAFRAASPDMFHALEAERAVRPDLERVVSGWNTGPEDDVLPDDRDVDAVLAAWEARP